MTTCYIQISKHETGLFQKSKNRQDTTTQKTTLFKTGKTDTETNSHLPFKDLC